MTENQREIRNAYARGYNAGASGRWPAHRPPQPPNQLVSEIMQAASNLRADVDDYLATLCLDDDDELEQILGPRIDAVDTSMEKVSLWLKEPDYETL